MPRVWLSLGSNIDAEANVRAALRALRKRYGALVVSPVYEAEAVGFSGDPFLNLVVGIDTSMRPADLHRVAAELESEQGRQRSQQRFSARTLDVDVLTYGDEVTEEGGKALPRDDIERYAFVLRPLADIAPDEKHPRIGLTYSELWQRMPESKKTAMKPVRLGDDIG